MVEVKTSKDNVEFVQFKKKEVEHVSFVNFAMFYYIKVAVLSECHTIKKYYSLEESYYMDCGILYKY